MKGRSSAQICSPVHMIVRLLLGLKLVTYSGYDTPPRGRTGRHGLTVCVCGLAGRTIRAKHRFNWRQRVRDWPLGQS